MDGSTSAEQGLGELQRHKLLKHKAPVALSMMRAIKLALDPQNVLNPGRVLEV
jgi:FAD/FMN-containing dehydrogenase